MTDASPSSDSPPRPRRRPRNQPTATPPTRRRGAQPGNKIRWRPGRYSGAMRAAKAKLRSEIEAIERLVAEIAGTRRAADEVPRMPIAAPISPAQSPARMSRIVVGCRHEAGFRRVRFRLVRRSRGFRGGRQAVLEAMAPPGPRNGPVLDRWRLGHRLRKGDSCRSQSGP